MADTDDSWGQVATTVLASSWDMDAVLVPPMRRHNLTAEQALVTVDDFI